MLDTEEKHLPKELQWTRELVNKFWDGVSQTPLTELSFARLNGQKLIHYVGNHLPPSVTCLDFGSGGGDLIALLVKRGCRAAAFEPSEERSKDLVSSPFAGNPNFLGVVDNDSTDTFDVVIAAEVLEHVLDAELPEVVNRLRRFLSPGGTLIATTPNNEDLKSAIVYCPVSDLIFHRWQHLRSFTAESLDACLSTGGFRRIEDHRVDFSGNTERVERIRQLKHEIRYLRWLGPLYFAVAPLIRSRRKARSRAAAQGGLRIGAQSTLIYVGKAV
jgi:2-polyprenyl-3-methyl-5-hydroxy-6-metoxy-1,4-benzoquinol methylase